MKRKMMGAWATGMGWALMDPLKAARLKTSRQWMSNPSDGPPGQGCLGQQSFDQSSQSFRPSANNPALDFLHTIVSRSQE